MTNNNIIIATSNSTGYSYGNTESVQIGYLTTKAKRGPYKKGQFKVSIEQGLTKYEKGVIGKIKLLAEISNIIDKLAPNDQIFINLHKQP